jgi:hypothetical protein
VVTPFGLFAALAIAATMLVLGAIALCATVRQEQPEDEGKVTPGIRRRGPIRTTWPQDPGEGLR